MRSTVSQLEGRFDLLVIGGGIHGAFATFHAVRRGLRVLLLERGDFGSGTSGNSLRIAHGGLRYMAKGDLPRMRESVSERAALMRLAPHLVHPLPCALPLAGPLQRPAFTVALRLNDLVVRAFGGDASQPMPPGRVIARSDLRELASDEWWGGASTAALWYDALIASPSRLLVMVLRDAVAQGALVRNYTAVESLLRGAGGRITGAKAVDTVSGEQLDVSARVVLNATGPATASLIGDHTHQPCDWADGWNVVLDRSAPGAAIALPHPTERRMLFAVPWRDRVVLGTAYAAHRPGDEPDGRPPPEAPRAPTTGFLRERAVALVRDAVASRPALAVREEEIVLAHAGTLPMARDLGPGRGVMLLDRALLIDHSKSGPGPGLVSMIGVKWTTARRVAERAVDLCEQQLRPAERRRVGPALEPLCTSSRREVEHGGSLSALYGPLAAEVTEIARAQPELATPLSPGANAIGAQVVHALRLEAAVRLTDVLMRRTEIGTAGWPGDELVRNAARIMGREAGWSEERMNEEVVTAERLFGRCE